LGQPRGSDPLTVVPVLPMVIAASLLAQGGVPPASGSLEAAVRRILAASGAQVAVAYRTLDGHAELFIDPDTPFHAASTMKVPVMIELFRQARAGRLTLDAPLPIVNAFHSIVDGSRYTLSENDAADREVVAVLGRTLTLRQLCEAMITVSSNFATNLLIERLGAENIRRTVLSLGAEGMNVLRGVEDQKAFDKGLNNTTTARALLVLLERIAQGHAVDRESDAEMIRILSRQKVSPDAIAAGVPRGIVVAHKTGNITRIHHDAAIVLAPRPYVLVILVRGMEELDKSAALMAAVSKIVFESLAGPGAATPVPQRMPYAER
jgi:beta-lactamase class A